MLSYVGHNSKFVSLVSCRIVSYLLRHVMAPLATFVSQVNPALTTTSNGTQFLVFWWNDLIQLFFTSHIIDIHTIVSFDRCLDSFVYGSRQ